MIRHIQLSWLFFLRVISLPFATPIFVTVTLSTPAFRFVQFGGIWARRAANGNSVWFNSRNREDSFIRSFPRHHCHMNCSACDVEQNKVTEFWLQTNSPLIFIHNIAASPSKFSSSRFELCNKRNFPLLSLQTQPLAVTQSSWWRIVMTRKRVTA